MTADAITTLRNEIEGQIEAGASTEEIEQWADAYTFSRRDLVEVIRLLIDEIGSLREMAEPSEKERANDVALDDWSRRQKKP